MKEEGAQFCKTHSKVQRFGVLGVKEEGPEEEEGTLGEVGAPEAPEVSLIPKELADFAFCLGWVGLDMWYLPWPVEGLHHLSKF